MKNMLVLVILKVTVVWNIFVSLKLIFLDLKSKMKMAAFFGYLTAI